jgi:hypothetical protein
VFSGQAFQVDPCRGKLAALPSAFDTLAYVRRLRSVGVSQEQAEAHAEALCAAVLDTLATKQDLRELALATKQDLRDLEFRLTMRLGGMVGVSVATVAALTRLL